MAKRRKPKKSKKCPEPFNTLIDLAAAATLDYIAYKRRKKRGGKPTRIDPYEAAGIAFGLGKLETTEDILELGGMLGAMGAFDDDPSYDDGLQYGISREDYATRDEYVTALNSARFSEATFEDGENDILLDEEDVEEVLLCRVSCLSTGRNEDYHSRDITLRPGEQVLISENNEKNSIGIILTVDLLEGQEAIDAIDETPEILGRV